MKKLLTLLGALATSSVWALTSCGGDGGAGAGSDAGADAEPIECVVPSDCDDLNPCTIDACVENACERELSPDGDAPVQTDGDCRSIVCAAGTAQTVLDNGDVPDDDEPCTLDVCSYGIPQHRAAIDATQCSVGKGNGQCKAGVCLVSCTPQNASLQCDDARPCTEDACLPCDEPECGGQGRCAHQGLSGVPTPGAAQSEGDCREQRCVEGKAEDVADNFDAPDDGNECTVDLCKAGEPGHLPQSVGTACGGGSYKCDGSGKCVQCITVADCSDYTAGACNEVACSEGSCTLDPLPAGTSCGPNGELCGASGTCCQSCASTQSACGSFSNGCGETLSCGTCPVGQTCNSNQCCTPESCAPGMCGQQSDGCGGTITCGSCAPGDSCASGTCNCSNGAKNSAETDVDCGGVCTTKCGQGLACLAGSDCASGNCVDGVCCNTACSGVCEACTAALTGQANGLCANVSDGTDPGNECAAEPASSCGTTGSCKAGACDHHGSSVSCGAASCSGNVQSAADHCDGSGNCVDGGQITCTAPYGCGATSCQSCSDGAKNGNELGVDCGASGCPGCPPGVACTMGSQCASGSCVDGSCCNTACGGTCMACNVSGNSGTCSPIPFGQDPNSECPGSKTCNGSGGCT